MALIDRINKSIDKIDKNINDVEKIELNTEETEVFDRAKSYTYDGKYYLKKGDELTAFACIEYAHGLLDGIRMIKKLI